MCVLPATGLFTVSLADLLRSSNKAAPSMTPSSATPFSDYNMLKNIKPYKNVLDKPSISI